jgi:hypothetical protein
LKHPRHLDRVCENLATEPDGYCKACHDYALARLSGDSPEPDAAQRRSPPDLQKGIPAVKPDRKQAIKDAHARSKKNSDKR